MHCKIALCFANEGPQGNLVLPTEPHSLKKVITYLQLTYFDPLSLSPSAKTILIKLPFFSLADRRPSHPFCPSTEVGLSSAVEQITQQFPLSLK